MGGKLYESSLVIAADDLVLSAIVTLVEVADVVEEVLGNNETLGEMNWEE